MPHDAQLGRDAGGSCRATPVSSHSAMTSGSRSTTVTASTAGCRAMLAAAQPMPSPITTTWPRDVRHPSSWLSTSRGDSDIQVSHCPDAPRRCSPGMPATAQAPEW
ncbi:hypothetical protein [Paenacidovorax monticola]|uniref:Uncharacterized protein n=1 Tax=Paenacidovorax monticola TaxID=1926868 RepID=A0A7H0HG83_9BURK|nr:hypothetical protein [Paenacidovorax monticola]QNP59549.1 hypothetical protein H9L24_00525 [Paenacidovorax monticola]